MIIKPLTDAAAAGRLLLWPDVDVKEVKMFVASASLQCIV